MRTPNSASLWDCVHSVESSWAGLPPPLARPCYPWSQEGGKMPSCYAELQKTKSSSLSPLPLSSPLEKSPKENYLDGGGKPASAWSVAQPWKQVHTGHRPSPPPHLMRGSPLWMTPLIWILLLHFCLHFKRSRNRAERRKTKEIHCKL